MSDERWKALVVDQHDGAVEAAVRELSDDALPEGDVVVRVAYSSLNYKDGLAMLGRSKIVRNYPMVPGVDLAGTVEQSASPAYRPGDPVVLTGWGVGERHWGGYAQKARVRADWLVPLPEGLTARQAMAIGTAGFTAMMSVMALEEHQVTPGGKPVVVTGAAGGVGSTAVALLASRGYPVTASTGRAKLHDYLRSLGASQVVGREDISGPTDKPLLSERWAGAVDTVGGDTLAGLLRSMAYGSSVAACGLAGGSALSTTVMPFILRGVNLLGIDSVMCPRERRLHVWDRLVRELRPDRLDEMTQMIPLGEVEAWARQILEGRVRGRVVVDVNA
jgi:acrylyl-CoA reductase (NADPH)